VNQNFHPGLHPDADQLSIFVEGADTAREREHMLAHLAECRECRDVVFLMQGKPETSSAAKEASEGWVWQRWFAPAVFAGAALVAIAGVLIYVRPSTRNSQSDRQVAVVQRPEIAAPGKPLAPGGNGALATESGKGSESSETDDFALADVRGQSAGSADSEASNAPNEPSSAGALVQGTQTVTVAGSAPRISEAAPKPEAQLEANSIQQIEIKGRNTMDSPRPAAPPAVQAGATPSDSLRTGENYAAALPVEDQKVQNPPLSGVSGHVTDQSGAIVAGAAVVLRDGSGSTQQITTSTDGGFQLTGVPAGHYDLIVTAPGFKINQQSIDLKPSGLAMVQPVLGVGAVTESVVVTAQAAAVETDSASLISTTSLPSRLPVTSSVSLDKRLLSLDDAGGLFLSRNAGKSWKKVHPQWTGKAVSIGVIASGAVEAKAKGEASGSESGQDLFQLTTDAGARWTSKDGTHWRPQ
jgi:hypothetical protein